MVQVPVETRCAVVVLMEQISVVCEVNVTVSPDVEVALTSKSELPNVLSDSALKLIV